MRDLTVSSRDEGRKTVVEVQGDIDLASAPVLRNTLESVLRDGRLHLVVDLTDVPFVDSSGLGVLVGAQRLLRPRGGGVQIVCAAPRVLRVFSITGLDQLFTVHDTLQDALVADDESDAGKAVGSH